MGWKGRTYTEKGVMLHHKPNKTKTTITKWAVVSLTGVLRTGAEAPITKRHECWPLHTFFVDSVYGCLCLASIVGFLQCECRLTTHYLRRHHSTNVYYLLYQFPPCWTFFLGKKNVRLRKWTNLNAWKNWNSNESLPKDVEAGSRKQLLIAWIAWRAALLRGEICNLLGCLQALQSVPELQPLWVITHVKVGVLTDAASKLLLRHLCFCKIPLFIVLKVNSINMLTK